MYIDEDASAKGGVDSRFLCLSITESSKCCLPEGVKMAGHHISSGVYRIELGKTPSICADRSCIN